VVDAQRQVGEPDVVVSPIFTPGNPTSADIYASGPWGASTEQSYAWKSIDNGDTYHVIGRLRPDIGPGGGDTSTEVDDQNFLFMTDLEALTQVASARSRDGGDTFTRNSAVSDFVGIDRQWMAIDNGLSPLPTDNTEFLTYRQAAAGSFVKSALTTDPTQTFINAQANFPAAMNSGAPCGDLIFDPHDRYLYLPCGSGQQVEVARAHVDPGQRTGLVFTSTLTPAGVGDVANLFPTLATDSVGNVYVSDYAKHVVQIYAADGSHIKTLHGDGQLSKWAATYVAADPEMTMLRQKHPDVVEAFERPFEGPVGIAVDEENETK